MQVKRVVIIGDEVSRMQRGTHGTAANVDAKDMTEGSSDKT
ncbi:MAG: hypothetical protein ACLR0U_30130 [Enterocloster clostridioformis]